MDLHNFKLGGVLVTFDAANTVSQSYSTIGGISSARMGNGTLVKQTAWEKIATTLRGAGRLPHGLDGLDYSQSMTLECMAPMSKHSGINVITIPASRRTDTPPFGYARLKDRLVRTGLSVVINTATLEAVPGADAYVVAWYPVLTVFADAVQSDFSGRGPELSWTINAEEV